MSYIQISNNAEDICQQADSLHLQSKLIRMCT